MIKITILKNNNNIEEIKVVGHANFNHKGYDIVCSAVSSIITTSVNGILRFNNTIDVIDNEDFIIKVLHHDNITDELLLNLYELLSELSNQYPKNLKIISKGE